MDRRAAAKQISPGALAWVDIKSDSPSREATDGPFLRSKEIRNEI
jgi:hypothetical protein